MDYNDINVILDWYCRLKGHPNYRQYRIETKKDYVPGGVRWIAAIYAGEKIEVLSCRVSTEEHALLFLVALAFGVQKPSDAVRLLELSEAQWLSKDVFDGAWSRLLYGINQDQKAGGEGRIAAMGLDILTNYNG